MNHIFLNSSSSASEYYWAECVTHNDRPTTGFIILLTTHCLEFLVGAPLNLWLIYHIHKQRSVVAGILPADFFPLHMALTQLAFFLVLPSLFVNHFLWQSSVVMNVNTLLNSMMMTLKPMLHCLVCLDRYMAVVRPIDYLRFKGYQYRWGCLGATWCIYILVVPFIILKRSSITACAVFLPVLAVDTFCSMSVLKTLKKSPPGDKKMVDQAKRKKGEENVKTDQSGCPRVSTKDEKQVNNCKKEVRKDKKVVGVYCSEPRAKKEMNSMKRKAFNTIVIIQVVLTLNYFPFIITLCMNGLVPAQRLKCEYITLALAAAASCSYLHPVLYLHRLGKLREVKKQVIRHLCH